MPSKRSNNAPTRMEDQVYYLVQFVDDGIFDIKTAKDIRTRDDNRKEARYGEIFYLCTIMYESDDKEDVMKRKNGMEKLKSTKSNKPVKRKLITNDTKKKENEVEDQRKSKKSVNHEETVRRKAEREKKQAEKEQAKALKEREKAENEKRKAALTERDNHVVAAMSSLAESLHEQSSSVRQNQAEANFGNEEMSDNEVLYLDDFDNTDTVSVVSTDSASSYNRNQQNDSVNKRTSLTQLTPLQPPKNQNSTPRNTVGERLPRRKDSNYEAQALDNFDDADIVSECSAMIQLPTDSVSNCRRKQDNLLDSSNQPLSEQLLTSEQLSPRLQSYPTTSVTSHKNQNFLYNSPRSTVGGKRPRQFTPEFLRQQERPTVGGKRPRSRFSLSSDTESCQNCEEYKIIIERQKQEIVQLKAQVEGRYEELPRPGKVPQVVADRFKMVEISRGRGVFLYEDQLINAKSKSSSTSAACFLLSCFYKNEELVGRNLTGANEKESVHPDILLSILDFAVKAGGKQAAIKQALRNKLSSITTRARGWQPPRKA